MIPGAHVRSADTLAPAEWIAEACSGVWGTVGALVPNQYLSVLRVRAPDPCVEDWWSAYRDLFAVIASIGERHTSGPDRAWSAVWDGHGYASRETGVAWQGPLDDDERRISAIRAELRQVPRFDLLNSPAMSPPTPNPSSSISSSKRRTDRNSTRAHHVADM